MPDTPFADLAECRLRCAADAEDWRRANIGIRLLRWGSYQLTRLLLGVAGYGGAR